MCGIAGFVGLGDQADIAAMNAALTHRGPDGEGFYSDRELGLHLGHRRLAIIDRAGGAQPMWNRDQSIGVVFNGEIYNHRELRVELEARGHVFRSSHSDTEVLVQGYAEWGETLPARLNGMFAFAIFDRARQTIFLARDRFGEKPLYYYARPGLFAFASEIGALRRHRAFRETINQIALQKFFAYGYLPAPHTLYEGCVKLPPGSFLVLDAKSLQLRQRSYWRFRLEPDESLTDTDADHLAEELRALLAQAVRRRLMSDVPLGIFLSGGIDSASVLASAARHLPPSAIRSFTIGFNEPSFDESAAARETARFVGTRHGEEILDAETARDLIPMLLEQLDEPLGDSSLIPTYLLSRFTRRHVTVALSGDGGDELFAGYDPFRALAPAQRYQQLVSPPLHRGMRRLADLLPISARNMSWDFKLRRALAGLSHPSSIWNPVWMAPVEPEAMKDLFRAPLAIEEVYSEAIQLWDEDPRKSPVDRTLEFFTNFYLPDDILTKVDRASMMVSLESRAVFLDNDLVDFCRRLPARFKYRDGERKWLLKRAVATLLPRAVAARPKKGFGIPVASWLRRFPDRLPAAPVAGVNLPWVTAQWRAHRAGKRDQRALLWCWLSLQAGLSGKHFYEMAA